MKKCTFCKDLKNLDLFHKSNKTKDGKRSQCKSCAKEYTRRRYLENREKIKEANKVWRNNNPEKIKEIGRSYRTENKDKLAHDAAKWHALNAEKICSRKRDWARANPDKIAAKATKRRANKLQATPVWANSFFIEEAYALAKLRTKMLGYSWHVDHIVPLKSELVCGLHCEANLQVIPGKANLVKSNSWWPDMPE
jgi:hypothetical protein